MQLSQIEIINLWDTENITLPFTDRVTFLTGINGSGKSTLLNIIYDTLDVHSKKGLPATSKNRFWSAKATFSNNVTIQTAILPEIEQQKSLKEEILKLHKSETSVHNFNELKKIEHFYQANEENQNIHHINYSSEIKGQFNIQTLNFPSEENSESNISNKPLAFLFQEDRETLHNIDKSNIDFSLNYWALYKNSIDGRFAYLRNAIQILESQNNSMASELILSDKPSQKLEEMATYKDWKSKSQSINAVIKLLNSYFLESGKELTRDSENKLTLQHINSQEKISWHLLSRGEKTLIYLFFVVFLYKDKVSLFLFDEPEISLHVKWQHNLIKDLSDLAPDNQFIIATHSPSLVQNGWLGHCLELSEI
ncbi:MAG: AAA family ATPase [Methyloprofundus sp.]|nr:AAA family ATPase [Methyloprofundus sp.]